MAASSGRVGFHPDFFEPYKVTHIAVESSIESVTPSLAEQGVFMRLGDDLSLEARLDLIGQAHEDARDIAMVFQLQGQSWTQIFADIRAVNGLPLARELSRSLDTRVFCLELTDDAYNTRGLFDRGKVLGLEVDATSGDIKMILDGLDMPVPEEYQSLDAASFEHLEEASYTFLDDDQPQDEELADLVQRLGLYLHCIYLTDEAHYGLQDVETDEVVRLDMIVARRQESEDS